MPDERKPKLIRNCRLMDSPIQGEMILMPEGALRLKGTGATIVGLCDGVRSLDEILAALKSQFPSVDPLKVEAEAISFLNTLREKRVMDF